MGGKNRLRQNAGSSLAEISSFRWMKEKEPMGEKSLLASKTGALQPSLGEE